MPDLKKSLFLIAVLAFFGSLGFFFYTYSFDSFFGSFNRNPSIKDLPEYSFYTEIHNNFNNNDYFKDWDYLTSYIVANISEINYIDNTMNITIILPKDQSFSNAPQDIPVLCTPENTTTVMAENFLPVDQNVNIYDQASPGDSLYSYCLDSECKSLGNKCILVNPVSFEEPSFEDLNLEDLNVE